jgi:hypothetical protein
MSVATLGRLEQKQCANPLCVTCHPWATHRSDVRRSDGVCDASRLVVDGDFRDKLDEQQPEFQFQDGEIVARSCSLEWVFKLQEIGCVAVVSVGKELYDLFFPADVQDELAAVMS